MIEKLAFRVRKSFCFRKKKFLERQKQKKIKALKEKHSKYLSNIKIERSFTIISSNCWGGSIYEDLQLPYQTPTVGLFFYAPCFLVLLSDLKKFINSPLEFISESSYEDANRFIMENHWYPIGILNDKIEIHFLHYRSEKEALEKWERRKKRVNWDNLFVSCTDRDGMTADLMKTFDSLPFENKILFTSKRYPNISSAKRLKYFKKSEIVGDLYNERYAVTLNFNIEKWLMQSK